MNLFSRLLIPQLVPQNLFEKAQPSQYPFFLFKHVYKNLMGHLLGLSLFFIVSFRFQKMSFFLITLAISALFIVLGMIIFEKLKPAILSRLNQLPTKPDSFFTLTLFFYVQGFIIFFLFFPSLFTPYTHREMMIFPYLAFILIVFPFLITMVCFFQFTRFIKKQNPFLQSDTNLSWNLWSKKSVFEGLVDSLFFSVIPVDILIQAPLREYENILRSKSLGNIGYYVFVFLYVGIIHIKNPVYCSYFLLSISIGLLISLITSGIFQKYILRGLNTSVFLQKTGKEYYPLEPPANPRKYMSGYLFRTYWTRSTLFVLWFYWSYTLFYVLIIRGFSVTDTDSIFCLPTSLLLFFVSIPLVWNIRLWFYLKKNPLSLGNVNAE